MHTVSRVTATVIGYTLCSIVYEPDPVPVLQQVMVLSDVTPGWLYHIGNEDTTLLLQKLY